MSIDRYDPIRVLGEGSFGKVYLMRDKIKRNFVCVKIIKIKNIPKKEREATKMEVDLLKRLHHPNIVGYIDSFLSKNHESLCICMEYCDGGDLASQIKAARRNLFSEGKILHWFVQLALGLHYMHSNKVLHRDLKTQNIFLLGNGRLVLGDLGISKVLDGTMDFAQTCIGTPYYMSPEIFQNKPYSYKSDIWALGCVLYEMTTLNHAFDANSLNGLATKIVKGKYPPIHAKYSRYLRELIGQMLMINPQQRPDMEQILRKAFIKKHVVNFFVDIASRPQTSIGEGTMVFKAAAGGPVNGNSFNDSAMISLRQQLNSLDMADSIADAMRPKGNPVDDQEAIKLAREQAGALKREQEHKRMVEAALEKLRVERENRAKVRNDPRQVRGAAYNPQPQNVPVSARREEPVKRPAAGANQYSPQPSQAQLAARNVSNEALRKEARDNSKDRLPPNRNEESPAYAAGRGGAVAGRRRTFGEEKDREQERMERDRLDREKERERERIEREKKAIEERRRIAQEQEIARLRAEERKREEVRAEAKAREEARLREEAKLREEQAERMRMEQVRERAEAAARAKREAQRERERERQREEIEQLKRDKLELDRRAMERDRQRDERRADERQRIDDRRKEQMDIMQLKLDNMNDQIGKLDLNRNGANRAEEKGGEEQYMSARERVYLKRQEKQAKEEAERLEALREAEMENRRIRMNAQQEYNRKVYGDNVGALQGQGNAIGSGNRVRSTDEEETPRYQFDAQNRRVGKNKMDNEELNDRLEEAVRGKGGRYEDAYDRVPSTGRGSANDGNKSSNSSTQLHEGSDSGSDEELFEKGGEANGDEEEEEFHRREEELRAELNFATMRCEELKRTLQETKTFLGPRLPTRKDQRPAAVPAKEPVMQEDEDDEDLYDLGEDDEYEESYEESNQGSSKQRKPTNINTSLDEYYNQQDAADRTIRRIKQPDNGYHLQDAPSPSGKLSDRIERLRQRCMEALGRDAFMDAYNFLKQHELESQGYENGRDLNDDDFEAKKIAKIRAILGEGKAHYMSLIDQLIFMEGAERD